MNLSEEQLKALAEFLGVEAYESILGPAFKFKGEAMGWDKFPGWLHGNDGQAALMDTLDAGKVPYDFVPLKGEEYFITMNDGLGRSSAVAKTRQEALINAVLSMIGKDKCATTSQV